MAIPPHRVEEKNGRRAYIREEQGGSKRVLQVWTLEGCREKVREKMAQGKVQEFFDSVTQQRATYFDGTDPMMKEWFEECYANAERAYDELNAPIEEFGLQDDDIEEFGT